MTPLQSIAEHYGVNSNKKFFPVNSLRLLYFMIVGHYTQENADAIERIGSLIPKGEAVFSARLQHRNMDRQATVASDIAAVQAPLQDVFAVVDTPKARMIFDELFTYIYPMQDRIFLSLYEDITSNQSLTKHHLQSLLDVRAMDSVVFATLIGEVIATTESSLAVDPVALYFHLHLMYEINDIVDSVVFAQEDVSSSSFSLFQVIRKIAPEAMAAKELIREMLNTILKQTNTVSFSDAVQINIQTFYDELAQVVTNDAG